LAADTIYSCQTYVIPPQIADMAKRGIAAVFFEEYPFANIVLESQLAISQHVYINNLDIRRDCTHIIGSCERCADFLVAALIMDAGHLQEWIVRLIPQREET